MIKEDLNIAIGNAGDKPSKTSTTSKVLQKVGAGRLLCAVQEERIRISEIKREV